MHWMVLFSRQMTHGLVYAFGKLWSDQFQRGLVYQQVVWRRLTHLVAYETGN